MLCPQLFFNSVRGIAASFMELDRKDTRKAYEDVVPYRLKRFSRNALQQSVVVDTTAKRNRREGKGYR